MNDPDDLEALLTALPLRRPSAGLDARIAAAARRRGRPVLRWAVAATVVLAAGAAVIAPRRHARPTPPAVSPAASPVWVERVTSQAFDDGLVAVTDRVPYRRVRRQTVRQIWWVDPATGTRLWAEVPSERVSVEPAETF